ncbi:pyridoxal phosphate-dependent aminotransferase [Nonomuraea antri]|uniref:pyridoxal phosphate-dependent aminotransferase n=1 Tax=Nonomuraea antri TaxID=2730852 RepID=UPI001C2C2B89|nr:pyridoxal phosphate-dependent aminotransferase [Nonomuraea antri]
MPEDAVAESWRARTRETESRSFSPAVDDRTLEVFRRARRPDDPMELRDLWLGRVEHELGAAGTRPWLAERWRSARRAREVTPEEVLRSRATVRFVKELFNAYFRDDLYGEFASPDNLVMSSGAVEERHWGLPESLKECIRFALDQDWYGYSDSRGRASARQAVAAYENARIEGEPYGASRIALTIGATFAVSTLADFILDGGDPREPALCAIPNYPPLVETVARRGAVTLVPLPSVDGTTSLEPLIAALTPSTPLVLLQTAGNPTGAMVREEELARLIAAAAPTTMIVLDECHEWLGPSRTASARRAAPNVIRVSSLSKTWSAPGLKVGWITADAAFIDDYYEHASTTFGGPPSFFYTVVEVLARMEHWLITGVEEAGAAELGCFEPHYGLRAGALDAAYQSYRRDRAEREQSLDILRAATVSRLADAGAVTHLPRYSINAVAEFGGWDDSYLCFRDLLRETGVSVFPGLLTFCFSGGVGRVTTSRNWRDQSLALDRIHAYLARRASGPMTAPRVGAAR